jgi:hypothetical protein
MSTLIKFVTLLLLCLSSRCAPKAKNIAVEPVNIEASSSVKYKLLSRKQVENKCFLHS